MRLPATQDKLRDDLPLANLTIELHGHSAGGGSTEAGGRRSKTANGKKTICGSFNLATRVEQNEVLFARCSSDSAMDGSFLTFSPVSAPTDSHP